MKVISHMLFMKKIPIRGKNIIYTIRGELLSTIHPSYKYNVTSFL